jgi:cytochrome b involved in lipid metabolism
MLTYADVCCVSGKVYDFTSFLDEHPEGTETILKYGGQDGSQFFRGDFENLKNKK